MTKILLQSLMMIGLGVMVYLIARALPRIDERELEPPPKELAPRWFTLYLEKFDFWLESFFEKFLRRFRLVILKVDNTISERLKKLKKETGKEKIFPVEPKEGEDPEKK